MTKPVNALYAEMVSELIATGRLKPAARIVGVRSCQRSPRRVYDLTVERAHSFYANGVWVSNSADALQYLCLHYNVQLDPAMALLTPRRREIKAASYAYT